MYDELFNPDYEWMKITKEGAGNFIYTKATEIK